MAMDDLGNQLKTMLGVKEAAADAAKGINSVADATDRAKQSTDNATKSTQKASQAQESFTEKIKQASDETEALNKRLETASKIAGGFGDALANAATGTLGVVKAAGNLIGSLFNVGKAILQIPFKLWDAFIEKSMNMPYNPAFAEALKETRKMFGDLASGSGKQVMDMYHNMRSQQNAIAKESGLGMSRIFGYGVEGRAAMLKFVGEMGQSLGSQMGEIFKVIGKDINKVTYGIKALGLSNEEAGKSMLFFHNAGMDANKMFQEMSGTAAMLAKQTGFNIKTLGKAMVETTQEFPHFAVQGVKAMAKVADYTHRLGISVKTLKSVYDAFDSFDAAAESASKLSQAFGINIDAMKMVKEQDPTKRMEMLRDSFKATGKSLNDLSSAERKHLLESMHLSEEDAQRVLGEGNKKKALSESEKAAKAASDAAKNQTKVLKELAKAIERIVPPQGEKFKGFFDAFTKGFSQGMFYSKNLGGAMRDIQASFRQVYWLGRDLAKLIFDNFPGMTKMADGFRKIFNPATFHKFRTETVEIFKKLFKDLETDPKAGFQKFFDRMKEMMGRVFGDKAGGGLTMMKEGFGKFTAVLGTVLGEALKKLIGLMTEGLRNFTDMITNPGKIVDTAKTAGGFAQNLFGPIVEALKEMGPVLWDAIKALLVKVFEAAKPWLEKAGALLMKFFAVRLALNLGMALVPALASAGLKAIFANSMKSAIAGSASNVAKAASESAAAATKTAAQTAQAAAGKAAASMTAATPAKVPAWNEYQKQFKDSGMSSTQRSEMYKKAKAAEAQATTQSKAVGSTTTAAGGATGSQDPTMGAKLAANIKALGTISLGDLAKAALVIAALAVIVGGVLIILALAIKGMLAILTPKEFIVGALGIALMAGALALVGLAFKTIAAAADEGSMLRSMGLLGIMALAIPILGLAVVAAAAIVTMMPNIPVPQVIAFAVIAGLLIPAVGLAFWAASRVPAEQIGQTLKGLLAIIIAVPILAVAVLLASLAVINTPTVDPSVALKWGLMTVVLLITTGLAIAGAILIGATVTGPQALIALAGLAAILITMPLLALAVMVAAKAISASGIDKMDATTILKFGLLTGILLTTATASIIAAAVVGAIVILLWPVVAVGMLALNFAITAITEVVSAAGIAINASMKDIDPTRMIGFVALATALFGLATVLIPISVVVGIIAIAAGGILVAGMLTLGISVLAITGLTALAVEAISKAGTPAQILSSVVALIAFGFFMTQVAALIPIAANLGLIAMSFFGVGAVAIIAGFVMMGKMIQMVTKSTVEIVKAIASMQIGDPQEFKAKVEAFVAIFKSLVAMTDSFASMFKALDPGAYAQVVSGGDAFNKNLESANRIIGTMTGAAVVFLDKLKEFAESAKIDDDSLKVIKSVGEFLTVMAALMKTLSPSDETMKAAAEAADQVTGSEELTNKIFEGAKAFAGEMGSQLRQTITTVSGMITTLAKDLADKDFSEVGPLMSGVAEMFKAIGTMMNAMQPNDAVMKTVATAVEQDMNSKELTQQVFDQSKNFAIDSMKSLFGDGTPTNPGMVNAFVTFFQKIRDELPKGDIKSESLEMAKGIGGIIAGAAELMKAMSMGGSEKELIDAARNAEKIGNTAGPATADALKSMIETKKGGITDIMQKVKEIITEVGNLGNKDFEKVGPVTEMISSVLRGVGPLLSSLSMSGPEADILKKAIEKDPATAAAVQAGITKRMTDSVGALTNPATGLLPAMKSMIVDIVSGIQPVLALIASGGATPEALKNMGVIMGHVGSMITGLMKAATELVGALTKVEDPTLLKGLMTEAFTAMGGFLQGVGPSLKLIIDAVLDVAKTMPADAKKNLLPKIEVLNKTMEAVVKIAELFSPSGALGGMTKIQGANKGDPATMASSIDMMMKNLDTFTTSVLTEGGGGTIGKFAKGIANLPVAGIDKAKAASLKAVMDAMKTVTDIMVAFKVDPKAKGDDEGIKGVMKKDGPLDKLSDAMASNGVMYKFMERFGQKEITDLMNTMKKVPYKAGAESMNNIKAIITTVKEIGEIAADNKFTTAINAIKQWPMNEGLPSLFLDSGKDKGPITKIVEAFINGGGKTLVNNKKILADAVPSMQNFAAFMSNVASFANSLSGAVPSIETIVQKKDKIEEFAKALGDIFNSLKPSLGTLTSSKPAFEAFRDAVDPLIKAFNQLGSATLGNMNTNIMSIATSLGDGGGFNYLIKSLSGGDGFESLGVRLEKVNFSGLKTQMNDAADMIKSYLAIYDMAKLAPDEKEGEKVGRFITQTATSLAEASKKVDGLITATEPSKEKIAFVSAVANMKGGKFHVEHNIPNLNFNVVVKLDTHDLAKNMMQIDVQKNTIKGQRTIAHKPGPQDAEIIGSPAKP